MPDRAFISKPYKIKIGGLHFPTERYSFKTNDLNAG
jgi:hypothetical protein